MYRLCIITENAANVVVNKKNPHGLVHPDVSLSDINREP